jgi:hypothetical protein
MPRTSSQPRPREGLLSLDDDALRSVLSFLSVADARRGPGETSKALRQAVASNQLARARATAPYVLRGDTHGVVHALATSMGTRRWPTRVMRDMGHPQRRTFNALVPPASLGVTVCHLGTHGQWDPGSDDEILAFLQSGLVDQDVRKKISCPAGCTILPGSYNGYELPFKLQISHFRFSVRACGHRNFRDWTFEAFDDERAEWRGLYLCEQSPWAEEPYQAPGEFENFEAVVLPVEADFASTRFRIRLLESEGPSGPNWGPHPDYRCMHIRGLDVFGTVLPPWQV